MPLSDDQRAMLQLLLQRGQSYDDIGSLLGLEVGQVRSRARAALTEIGGEDPDTEVGLTDYLLGQADPIGRADVARRLQSDSQVRDLAERLATQLRVLAPGAELPELAAADGGKARPRKAASPAPKPAAEPVSAGAEPDAKTGVVAGLSPGQRQAIAALFGGGLILVLIVLAVTGVFGGGDGDDSGSSSEGGSSQQANNASNLTRAELTAPGGGDASGVAVFVQVRQQPALQINVTGLEPTARGEGYVIWLFGNRNQAFPLVRQSVGENGQLRGAAPIPTQLIQALQQDLFDSISVSLASDDDITAALRQARRSQRLPRYAGETVASGPITGPGFPASDSAG
jgi:hypothetical protein